MATKAKQETIERITSGDVKALLENRYAAPQYAFFTEVANGTGAHQAGYADGVAFGLWPSMGFPIYGFEVKVSRSDWLRELKPENVNKATPVMQYCDKWWLVAAKGVALVEEIPKAWGFLEVVNGKLFTRKQAPDLEPKAVPPEFYAALLRRATESTVPASTVHGQVKKAREDARAEFAKDIEESKEKLKQYHDDVKAWEESSGLKVFGDYRTSSRDLGKVVRWVLEGGLKRTMNYQTESAIKGLREVVSRLEHFDGLRKEFPEFPEEIKKAAGHW